MVRLRWVAILGQVVTLSFAYRVLHAPGVLIALATVVGILVLANLRALQLLSRASEVDQRMLLVQLELDVVALTCFFMLAGGPDNPFTMLYLIHVAMASIMLRPRLATVLTVLVLACYALLHALHLPLHLDRHSFPPGTLATGGRMAAFAITATSIATFAVGLASTLRRRERQLLEARDRTARTDRLRSVGTLAAGAAHELNTPLSTVGLRVRRIARRYEDAETTRDLEVIVDQLERCKLIVEQLLVGAGDPSASGLERRRLGPLVEEAVALWRKGSGLDVRFVDGSDGLEVEVPRIAFVQALINLMENAREAQLAVDRVDPIEVEVMRTGTEGEVVVRDRGCGLPEDPDRVGEPFFTTKTTGTGLGVFVARAVADGAGGGLRYVAGADGCTEARWWFPETTRRPT